MNRVWTRTVLAILVLSLLLLEITPSTAQDWPMWRFDAQRTAASQNELPDRFDLLWQKTFPPRKQAWDDPLNHDLMTYDRLFEPIVIGDRMFLSFNDRDKVAAFDT
ncbi:MAG: hypothetical protein ACR2NZ_02200, partial [Rubripirellula sp.]